MRGRMVAGLTFAAALVCGDGRSQVGAKPAGALISAQAVVVNPTLHKAYAIDQRGGMVLVVDETKGTRSTVRVGEAPEAIAVNATTNRVYVANRVSGTLSVLDGVTDEVLATVPVGARPFAVVVDAVTNRVYVSNTFNDTMTILDGTTQATSTMKGGCDPARAA